MKINGTGSGYSSSIGIGLQAQPLPAISLSNTNFSGIQILDEVYKNNNYHESVKKYEVVESLEDILALSVTWKRLNKTKSALLSNVSNLLSKELFMHITDEDRELGKEIRDYYSKKIMIWKLKNYRFSKFRNDLNTYVHNSNPLMVKNDLLGMIYYLPYFYEYDTELDEVRTGTNTKLDITNPQKVQKQLQPLKKIRSKKKIGVKNHYWLKDLSTGCAVQLAFDLTNPLEHIWDKLFTTKNTLEVTGLYYKKSLDDFEYFCIKNWELTNI
jgi:hypothetical protein